MVYLGRIISYLVLFYQKFISPFSLSRCRFHPTCSEYSRQALCKYGVLKGSYLSVRRLLRCNPYFQGGDDPLS